MGAPKKKWSTTQKSALAVGAALGIYGLVIGLAVMIAPAAVDAVAPRAESAPFAARNAEAEEAANAEDPVLNSVPAERRETLIAQAEGDAYRFDIHMQGDRETVFFDL